MEAAMSGIIFEYSGCAYAGVKVSNMCIFISAQAYRHLQERWRITKVCSAPGIFPLSADSSGSLELLKG